MRYAFADFELDDRIGNLSRRGERLHVRPKVIALLAHLIGHRVRVVYRQELLDLLWPDVSVGESSLSTLLNEARAAVGDSGCRQQIIRTFPRRGYRFIAPVELRAMGEPRGGAGIGDRKLHLQPLDEILVGRGDILARADAAICTLAESAPRHLLLCGEIGSGKSRTAREIASIARGRGMGVHFARCEASTDAPRLWPWSQVLKSLADSCPPDDLAREFGREAPVIAGLTSGAGAQMTGPWARGGLEASQARFHLFDCVSRLLRRFAANHPLMLVMEDLHWADRTSLLLLHHLIRSSRNGRLMVLATLRDRPHPRDAERRRLLAELDGDAPLRRLCLTPLSHHEVSEFLALAGLPEQSQAAVERLHEYSGGNPLFLADTLLSSARLGSTHASGDISKHLPPPSPHLRTRLEGVLTELPEGCHHLMQLAAVIGDAFSRPLLEAASPAEGERFLELIEAIEAADLIRPHTRRSHCYEFRHGVIRSALQANSGAVQKARLHLQIGEAMESLYRAELDRHLPALARHFASAVSGGGGAKAIDYATRAATQASERHDHAEGSRHYRLALETIEICPPIETERKCHLLAGLARENALCAVPDEAPGAQRQPAPLAQRPAGQNETASAQAEPEPRRGPDQRSALCLPSQ